MEKKQSMSRCGSLCLHLETRVGANNKSLNKGSAIGTSHGSNGSTPKKQLHCFHFHTPHGVEAVFAENFVKAKKKFLEQSGF